jgi:superoxide dismutase, Cu-Zn family
MRIGRLIGALTAACLASLPAHAQTAKASLKDAAGKEVGRAEFVQTPHGVLIKLSLEGVPAGERAFHIHAVGKCEPPFTSAGGHFNPDGKKHGMAAADGAHAGDMLKGRANSLFDSDGSALVIHAGADDYKTDPTGNAGDRIACGVIVQ